MLTGQTKAKLQKILEFKLNMQMENFSFSPPKNFVEEGKWLVTVTFFETSNSVFNEADENSSFSLSTPGHWSSRGGAKT